MKNSFYILLIFGFVISSCGTSKQYTSSEYGDAIYNNSPEKIIALSTATDEGVANLKQKTKELGRTTVNGYDAKVIYVNDEGTADIVVDGESSYLILDSTMSFEERLTKFRSPNYNINIYISDRWGWDDSDYYSPWWYMSSNPWFYRNRMERYYGSSFYYDWWGSPFSRWGNRYYDPWNYGYNGYYGYNSWYGNYCYGYYGYPFNRYYNTYGYYGWYGNYYGDKYGDWYSGGGHSGGHSSDRSRYVGKRVDNYRSPGNDNNGPSRGVVKNNPRIEQIGGTRVGNTPNREGSSYRRENKTGTSGIIHNTGVVSPNRSTGQTERTGTTYRRPSSEARVNSTGSQENRGNSNVTRTESSYRRSSVSVESYRGGNSQSVSSGRSANSPSRSSSSYERSSSSYERNSNSAGSSSVRSSNSGSTSSSSTGSTSSSSSSGSGSTYRR